MPSTIYCSSCKKEVSPEDKFCRSCGTEVHGMHNETAPDSTKAAAVICPSCGTENSSLSTVCTSCGATLPGMRSKSQPVPAPKSNPPAASLKKSQTWRLTLAIGILLVIAIIIFESRKPAAESSLPSVPPSTPQMTMPENVRAQLQAMEDSVKAHPEDLDGLLRLANTLQDNSLFPLAVTYYQQYIKLNPKNPDAIVDLGVTYFELSRADSVRRQEYLKIASSTMQEALTLDPKHQMACFNLGIVSLHMGDMDQAKSWFQRCADIDSTTERGREAKMLISQHSFNNP